MPNPLVQNVKKTTKDFAVKFAKQIAREPFEILKTASDQVKGVDDRSKNVAETRNLEESKIPDEQKLKIQSQRLMQALEKELEDIRNFEREKLARQAQLETQQPQEEIKGEIIIPQGKKKRLAMGFGRKKGPQGPTGTTKVEVRKPPSG